MKSKHPPKWINTLLTKVCREDMLEEIEGDLLEYYQLWIATYGRSRADRLYIWHAIKFLRPYILKIPKSNYSINMDMFQHYLKISVRSLLRNRRFTFINTLGLTIGLGTCLIILMFVFDELSYDRYNEKADQIVRVVLEGKVRGETIKEAVTPAPVAPTFVDEFPEVVSGTRLRRQSPKITFGNTTYRNNNLAFVDPNFFEVFTIPFLRGNPGTALSKPYTIVLTEAQAQKFFGETDPINKVLNFSDRGEQYTVTGIIEPVPENSHFHFDMFASMEGLKDSKLNNWTSSNYFNYLVLSKGAKLERLQSKMPYIVDKYIGQQFEEEGNSLEEFKAKGNYVNFFIQPLTDIHLYSDFDDQTELEPGGTIETVYTFAAIALFMLCIACINFINLSTAGATKRLKEIGVKKVMGSRKIELIGQFLTESSLVSVVAAGLAILGSMIVLPVFNNVSGKHLEESSMLSPPFVLSLLVLSMTIGLLAGGYPAFFLSSFKPVAALRNRISRGKGGKGIRNGLVVFQFMISGGLLLASLVVNQQMSFIQNKDVGYEREHLLVLRESYFLGHAEETFKDRLLNDPRVENITMSAFIPAGPTDNNRSSIYVLPDKDIQRRTLIYNIDEHYIPTLGMKIVRGRNFSDQYGDESENVIVNETGLTSFGLQGDPIGQVLTLNDNGKQKDLTVIGVVKDFHSRSLREEISPLIMLNNPYGGLILRTKTDDPKALLAGIEKEWEAFNTGEAFTYAFLNELYNETYVMEQKLGKLLFIFSMLTILVSCLGLFGLVTFTVQHRVKEIGVRKILGASVMQICTLLSRDFLTLIGIALLISLPLSYYCINKWLQNFAFRVEITWSVLIITCMISICIALMTISFQAIKAACTNPVNSIRNE